MYIYSSCVKLCGLWFEGSHCCPDTISQISNEPTLCLLYYLESCIQAVFDANITNITNNTRQN